MYSNGKLATSPYSIVEDMNTNIAKGNNMEVDGEDIYLYFNFNLNLSFLIFLSLTMISKDKKNKYGNPIPLSR
jgi:hypothetical protein